MRMASLSLPLAAALVVALAPAVFAAPVSFRGLTCDVVGSAAGLVWSPRSNVALYQVSNIGSSGQDGASTTLPMDCDGWQCAFGARPPGTAACDQLVMRFLGTASPGTPAFATFTQASSPVGATCALDVPSASRYAVQVWSGTELVYSATSASPPSVTLPAGVSIADSGVAVAAGAIIVNMRDRINALEARAQRAGGSSLRPVVVEGGRQRVIDLETALRNLGLLTVNGVAVTGDRFRLSATVAVDLAFRQIEVDAACLAGNGGFSVADHGVHGKKGLNAVNVKLACRVNDGATLSSALPGPVTRITVGPGMAAWRATCGDLLLPGVGLHAWGADFTPLPAQALAGGATLECRVPSGWTGTPDTLRVTAQDDGSGTGPSLALANADPGKSIEARSWSNKAMRTLASGALVVPVNNPPTGFHAVVVDGELLVRCPMPAGSFTTLGGALQACDSLEFRVTDGSGLGGACDEVLPCALTGHALDHLDVTQFASARKDQYLNAGGVVIVLDGAATLQPIGGGVVIHGISAAGGDGASFASGATGERVPLKGRFENGDIPDQQDFTARAPAADGGIEDVASLDWAERTQSDGLSHVAMSATFAHQTTGRVFVELSDGTTCDPSDLDTDGDGFMDIRALVAGATSIMGSASYRRDSPWTECFEVGFSSTVAVKVRTVDRYLIGLRVWRNHGGENVGTPAPAAAWVSLDGLPPVTPVTGTAGVSDFVSLWPHMHQTGSHLEAHGSGSVIGGYPVSPTWAQMDGGVDTDLDTFSDTTGVTLLKRVHDDISIHKRFGIGLGMPDPPLAGCAFTADMAAAAEAGDDATLDMTLGGTVSGTPVDALVHVVAARRGYQYYAAKSDMAAAGASTDPQSVKAYFDGVLQAAFDTADSLRFTNPPGTVVCIADDGSGRPLVDLSGFASGNVLAIQNGTVPCDRITIAPAGACAASQMSGECAVRLNGLPPGIPVTGVRLADVLPGNAYLAVGPGRQRGTFALSRPWPNPARGTLGASFALPATARVTARVYDVTGRAVATLADARFTPGTHLLRWDGRTPGGADAPAGLYFLRVTRDGGDALTARFTRLR